MARPRERRAPLPASALGGPLDAGEKAPAGQIADRADTGRHRQRRRRGDRSSRLRCRARVVPGFRCPRRSLSCADRQSLVASSTSRRRSALAAAAPGASHAFCSMASPVLAQARLSARTQGRAVEIEMDSMSRAWCRWFDTMAASRRASRSSSDALAGVGGPMMAMRKPSRRCCGGGVQMGRDRPCRARDAGMDLVGNAGGRSCWGSRWRSSRWASVRRPSVRQSS